MNRENLYRWTVSVALVSAGVVVGNIFQTPNMAQGQDRTPPPATFKSGGQLSVPILQDIAGTLHRMEERLARLETVALKVSKTKSGTGR